MSGSCIAPDTTELEEECMDRLMPWKCYSNDLRQFEEFPTIAAMATAKSVSVELIMDAIASNKGNLEGMHFVKR